MYFYDVTVLSQSLTFLGFKGKNWAFTWGFVKNKHRVCTVVYSLERRVWIKSSNPEMHHSRYVVNTIPKILQHDQTVHRQWRQVKMKLNENFLDLEKLVSSYSAQCFFFFLFFSVGKSG